MNRDDPFQDRSVEEITRRLAADEPPQPRVIPTHSQTEWNPEFLRTLSWHESHVLGRGADICVFFDKEGRAIGWRDDGRKGTEKPALIDRDAFLKAVVEELGLPSETRLGKLEPRELPPLGWTHEAVLFLKPVPNPDQILRVWVSPENLRVIQCLYGPTPSTGEKP